MPGLHQSFRWTILYLLLLVTRFPEVPLLKLDKTFVDEMIIHSREENPKECCGIIAGKDDQAFRLYRITNTEKSPYRYLMDTREQMQADRDAECHGWSFLAFYHSHTHSPGYPSATDIRMAVDSGWLDIYYILVSLMDKSAPAVRLFSVSADSTVTEHELAVR